MQDVAHPPSYPVHQSHVLEVQSLLFAACCAIFFTPEALAQTTASFDGRGRRIEVPIPRLDADIQINGALDEAAWRQAAVLTGFSQYRPVDGRPAEDSTQVLVFYAADAIHFGIRAFEAHGQVVRATLADRDNIGSDDLVQILLDTYNDNRRALLFAINPLGVQQDGVQSEGFDPSQSAGGRFDGVVDISPDFFFESRGRLTDWGYVVEIRIPFKSLRYQQADPQTWGLQIKRFTQHSGYEDTWTPAVRANASFLVQSGRLVGLTGLRRGTVVDVNPEFTSAVSGEPGSGSWRYGNVEPQLGGNLRWGITSNLTANATVNPDFSQVETDVGQVTVNERFALFFPEKRPFFLDGLEQYDTPNRLIYTRQIRDPLTGVKLTGKLGGTAIAYLGAADEERFSATTDQAPIFNLLRVRRDLGTSSTLGIVHTDRIEGSDYNRVSGADARVVWRKIWFSEAQLAGAWTRDPTGSRRGALWSVTLADRTGRSYGNHYEFQGITPNFETRSGFVPRTGLVSGTAANRFSWYGPPGALAEQITTFVAVRPLWRYGEFPRTGTFERDISSNWIASLRGGWRLRATLANRHQRFEETVYGGYRVVSGVDTLAMPHPRGLHNLWGSSAGVSTPNRTLTLSADAEYGATVIFAEAAEGRERAASLASFWRPTASLRIEGSFVHQRISRARDGSRFSTANIPRIKTEYQLTRTIFLRYVGQYISQDRTALLHARSGQPLLPSTGGELRFGTSAPVVVNDFRNDFLFSYKPTPGSVFFFGYGASLTEPRAFGFEAQQLRRVSDGLFLKASYTYRL
ncbi:MAG: DUF5916 domain-containing protein [Gemmatimonadaceae bacterium]